MKVYKEFRFEAAHSLPNVPPSHQCSRMHGHRYLVRVTCSGDVNQYTGMLIDYKEISDACSPVIDRLDHQTLNEIEGLGNSTSEILSKWIFDELIKAGLQLLHSVEVRETHTAGSIYER